MSANMEKWNQVKKQRDLIEAGGGKEVLARIRESGRLTARERISALVDENTFVEFGAFMKQRSTDFNLQAKETPADGVITGYGTVDGRLVFLYSQDSSVLGGSVGEIHARKICSVYKQALKMGAPVIGFLDSTGMRLQEGIDAFDAYGKIYQEMSEASGVIPQICVILGACMGSAALIPALSDFVFMTEKNTRLFLQSPTTLPGEQGKNADIFGTAQESAENGGLVHFVGQTEQECITSVKMLLDYLPSNNMEDAPFFVTSDDINREENILNEIVPEGEEAIDISAIAQAVADRGQIFEIQKEYGKGIMTGFARFNGYTTAVLGVTAGLLCSQCVKKAVRFIQFCDAFNIPVVTLTDVNGFQSEVNQGGLIFALAQLVHTLSCATVPKINVILRKGIGNAYLIFNSKHIGADVVLAWPQAEISVMDADAAVTVMYADELKAAENAASLKAEKIEEYCQTQSGPFPAASRGYVDDLIEPSETRKRIAAALEMLASKRESKPTKKHASLSL